MNLNTPDDIATARQWLQRQREQYADWERRHGITRDPARPSILDQLGKAIDDAERKGEHR